MALKSLPFNWNQAIIKSMKNWKFLSPLVLLCLVSLTATQPCEKNCADCNTYGCVACEGDYESSVFGTCLNSIPDCNFYGPTG